jgi:hypothetical protein
MSQRSYYRFKVVLKPKLSSVLVTGAICIWRGLYNCYDGGLCV